MENIIDTIDNNFHIFSIFYGNGQKCQKPILSASCVKI